MSVTKKWNLGKMYLIVWSILKYSTHEQCKMMSNLYFTLLVVDNFLQFYCWNVETFCMHKNKKNGRHIIGNLSKNDAYFFIIEESCLNTQSILHFYRHSHHSMDFLYFVAFPKYKFKLFFLSHFVAIYLLNINVGVSCKWRILSFEILYDIIESQFWLSLLTFYSPLHLTYALINVTTFIL